MITGRTIVLTGWTFLDKVMSLLLNIQSRLVITFLPGSKYLLILWVQSPSAVILETKRKYKSVTVFILSPSICHEVMGPDAMILVFWMLSFKSTFSLSSFTYIKRHKYTEELYKKDLHDPDNHDGVITHLAPDILECGQVGLRKHHYEQS